MTTTGTVVGSPAYMSPEQAAGRLELDARSDIYGLGVILYEALSGRLPFQSENYNTLIIDIAVHDPPPLATISSGLPKPVLELVKATMMQDREQRIQSAAALADRIEATLAMLGASPSLALPDPAGLGGATPFPPVASARGAASARAVLRTRRRSGWVAVVIGTAVVLGIGGAVLAVKLMPATATPNPPAEPAVTTSVATPPPAAPDPSASAAPVVTAEAAAPSASSASAASATASASAAPSTSAAKSTRASKKKKKKGVWDYD